MNFRKQINLDIETKQRRKQKRKKENYKVEL